MSNENNQPVAGSVEQAPDVCEICKQLWSAHEMGVPAPYCPEVPTAPGLAADAGE